MREPAPDPGDTEQGRRELGDSVLPDARDEERDERDRQRREDPGQEPRHAAELRSEQRQHETGVAAEHHRVQPPRHPVEPVEREEPAYERQGEEPPAARPDDPEYERQEDQRDQDSREERIHARSRAPKRRLRIAYSSTAARRSSASKSGQSVSVKTSSAYAASQRRKFESRSSPDVRTRRSTSPSSGA